MPAIPYNDTPVVDQPWDGPATEARLSNDDGQANYRKVYTWVDPAKDQDAKVAYSLPHHEVSGGGVPGAANVRAVRNALARLSQSNVPAGDQAAVKAHLQKHLDKFNAANRAEEFEVDELEAETIGGLIRIQTEGRVWAVTSRLAIALAELDGRLISKTTLERLAAAAPPRGGGGGSSNGVATIPLKGVMMGLGGGGGLLAMLMGGTSLQGFQQQLRAAAADPEVDSIVLNIDSPGGMVDHIPEVAADVRAARALKPVIAVSNTMAASAAYWLASQADEIAVTPSGEAGSIGVYQLHRDLSEAHQMNGVNPTLISAGKYKVEGNPYEPLSDEARSAWQTDVNDYYNQFTADVAKGRGVAQADVKDGYGEGRSLPAQRAVKAGLADRVDTLEGTVRRLSSPRGKSAVDQRRAEREEQNLLVPPEGTDGTGVAEYSPEERNRLLATLAGLR